MPADPNNIDDMIDEWARQMRNGAKHPMPSTQHIPQDIARAHRNRINWAIFAVCLSLAGWAVFFPAPFGVALGFWAQRNRGVKSTTSDRIASWAIFLGTVPIGVVLTVIVEHFTIRHH